jgi:hypothetical protein
MALACATKRIPENGVCLAPLAIGVFDYFFRQELSAAISRIQKKKNYL